MRHSFSSLLAIAAISGSLHADAQTATGASPYTCTQVGTQVSCNFQATIVVPPSNVLQAGPNQSQIVFGTGNTTPTVGAPTCAGLIPSLASVSGGGNTPVTLSLSGCIAPATYIYQWAAPVATATGTTAVHSPALSASTPSQTYSVNVCAGANTSVCSRYSATVTLANFGIAQLSGCQILATTSSVPAGGSATLSASCASGAGSGSGASYLWLKNGVSTGVTSSTYNVTGADAATTGAIVYTVQIANAAPSAANASATINVIASASCSNSALVNSVIDVNAGYKQVSSNNLFGTGNVYVVRLDVSASATTVGGLTALLSHAEGIGSERAFRTLVLSPCAGDFTSAAAVVLSANSVGTTIDLTINDPGRGFPNLTTGIWYVNIKNTACTPNTRCDTFIDWLHY